MLAATEIKNGLSDFFSYWTSWGPKDRAVDQPRFTFVDFLFEKGLGADPSEYGKYIYRDELSQKEYLVINLYVEEKGARYCDLLGIDEIISRPTNLMEVTEQEFKKLFVLKPADVDIQNDFVSFLKSDCEKNGKVFEDFRERVAGTRPDKVFYPAYMFV